MARLRALEDIFPTRTRTELIGDLLSSALDDVVYGLPMYKGEPHGPGPDGEDLFEVLGAAKQFRDRANKHFADIEKELGNKDAPPLFPGTYVAEQSDFED